MGSELSSEGSPIFQGGATWKASPQREDPEMTKAQLVALLAEYEERGAAKTSETTKTARERVAKAVRDIAAAGGQAVAKALTSSQIEARLATVEKNVGIGGRAPVAKTATSWGRRNTGGTAAGTSGAAWPTAVSDAQMGAVFDMLKAHGAPPPNPGAPARAADPQIGAAVEALRRSAA